MNTILGRSVILAGALAMVSCTSPSGETGDEQRAAIHEMAQTTLARLYEGDATAKAQVEGAAGHAVFSNVGLQIFFLGGGSGYGVAENHRTGERTYMKMGQLTAGLGLGLKDFRAVFYFDNEEVFTTFVDSGWEFGGSADAAAKSSEKGGAADAKGTAKGAIHVYQLTESGISLQATVNGTKYWKADALN
jgi:lipid-binding SYLF domain-containing protein